MVIKHKQKTCISVPCLSVTSYVNLGEMFNFAWLCFSICGVIELKNLISKGTFS